MSNINTVSLPSPNTTDNDLPRDDVKTPVTNADVETASQEIGQSTTNHEDATMNGAFGAAAAAGGKQFRVLGKWRTGIVLIHTEVGIGILALPSVLQRLGLIPGLLAILGVGILSTYTAYVLLLYWQAHRHIDNLPDALRVLGGRILAGVGAVGLIVNLSLACASASLAISVALNTLTGHSMCTVAFIGFAVLACYVLCIPRTMNFVAQFSCKSTSSWCPYVLGSTSLLTEQSRQPGPATFGIFVPIFIVIIALAVGSPRPAPPGADLNIKLWGEPTFQEGFTAFLSICYAFGGRQGFLMVMAEMKDPSKDYVPALVILQAFAIPMYLITGGAIYGLAGDYVTSPAIGTAPLLPAQIAYGILLLTLFCTGLFYGHAGIKYLFVCVMRDVLKNPKEMTSNSVKSWSIWVGLATGFWALVFVLANAIPVFNSMIAVSSALLVAWFSFGLPGIFWLHLNWKKQWSSKRMIALSCLNWGLVLMGVFLNVAGMYASIDSLVTLFNDPDSKINGPFSCGDNSLF
jgi:amino acid permease